LYFVQSDCLLDHRPTVKVVGVFIAFFVRRFGEDLQRYLFSCSLEACVQGGYSLEDIFLIRIRVQW
jgi:hypothetical protein